ncbi:hypothetical protein DRN98_00310 [Methanosarcinales archaeon]|nr:MAG: hypothetical protein DRN98_00310 [Methanosarcinales archaeon]
MGVETRLLDQIDCDLQYLTIGDENIMLTITYGKIVVWFGRRADRNEIRGLFADIASIDPKVTCEVDVLAHFSDIERIEGKGLVLLSYRRKRDKYRATFSAPLAKSSVLDYLVETIDDQLKMHDTEKTILWEADDGKIQLLVEKIAARKIAKNINISKKER